MRSILYIICAGLCAFAACMVVLVFIAALAAVGARMRIAKPTSTEES